MARRRRPHTRGEINTQNMPEFNAYVNDEARKAVQRPYPESYLTLGHSLMADELQPASRPGMSQLRNSKHSQHIGLEDLEIFPAGGRATDSATTTYRGDATLKRGESTEAEGIVLGETVEETREQ